ncbi:HTH-type transcriptional regulator tcmR [Mycolicibacterium phlei]|jgi:AcrR family transcriptional regulator|uniref:TetR/AcrR family transcriptional regulator n=1 Tax=Mycolicibacterium phlei TaxID=1771 RepID=UPI0007771504|nr:TetR/AcrR family transcriptional regulator [Mycolicibacterium phlei]AMO62946.1 Bacterial regulatory protein, tetR family [Mycolicibacterium phlei]KXW78839.1 TetR family transcriptional regulator [Mycolicibacterium phlei DSM 43071]STZ21412.1 HTH-type transcriptional regulator tcmR [Mycolicibacterium phlei]VEG11046.1 HTH-type transcriptional regulator tcmR [Mycobacteroides chelonae]
MAADGAPPQGLRERRRASVRRDIALRAAELFERQGVANTTAEQIAVAAGISLRTFYRHCPIKEEALNALLEEDTSKFLEEFERRPDDESLAVSAGAALVHAWGHSAGDTRRTVKIMLADPALKARWLAGVRRAQDLLVPLVAQRIGDQEGGLRASVLAALLVNYASTVLEHWVIHDQSRELDEIVEDARGVWTEIG